MSSGASSGYVGPSSVSDMINLQVFCLNGEGYVLELSGCSTGWKVYEMVSKQLPRKKGATLPAGAPPVIARARNFRQGSKPFLHLCSNRCLCSMVFYTKARIPGPRCTHCCRRDCANSRYNNCHVFEASAKKP